MKTVIVLVAAMAVVVSGAAWYTLRVSGDSPSSFRSAAVKRGDLVTTISATGTVEPEEVVDVGAQVVGRVNSLGVDPSDPAKKKSIDYGSVVQENTVLARIDDAVYKAQLDQAQATLERSKADLLQLAAHLDQSKQEWKRAESLVPLKAVAATDYDLDVANYKAAEANLEVGKATIKQNEAFLELAKTNLDYTVIKSPVKGVIVARRVNIGQTVVSSLNAPSLFLIAKDLKRMQVWASVNEADIGRIHVGLPVTFTCDAFPKDAFQGNVYQIRLNATMTQNVVTYTVVVVTDNSDGKLLPYLTANLQFQIDKRPDVLLVPNAALRWKPSGEQQVVPDARAALRLASAGGGKDRSKAKSDDKDKAKTKAKGGDKDKAQASAKSSGEPKTAKPAKDREERGRVWVKEGDYVRPIDVRLGNTDGSNTEANGDDLKEGMEAVIGEVTAADLNSDTTNPFAPKMFGKNGATKPRQ